MKQIKKTYRTASRSGKTAKMPDALATITNREYCNALTFNNATASHGSSAYLKPIMPINNAEVDASLPLHVEGDTLFLGEFPAVEMDFRDLHTDRIIREINTDLLVAIYSVIYLNTPIESDTVHDEYIDIYIPDFLDYISGSRNFSKDQKEAILRNIKDFHNIIGIIEEASYSSVHKDRYTLLLLHNICESTNTIRVSSPYMGKLISILAKKKEVTNKQTGKKKYLGNKPVEIPNYSFLIKGTLATARSRMAAEIVKVIVVIVAQCGKNGTPCAKTSTIIARCPNLNATLSSYKSKSDKNKLLKRSFSTAWDYLAKYTLLAKTPNPKVIKYFPCIKDLDKTLFFIFTEGRIEITTDRPKK